MGRLVTSPGILKNVQGQIDHVTDMYDDIKDNNLKPLTITLTSVANANGAISVVTNDDRITEDMKAIDIEVGTPESFKAPVTITTGAGTVTLTCTNASGNSTVKATFIKTSPVEGGEDYPPAVTSTEFDILADRIGSLATLETTDKSDLVSAVNEVVGDVDTLSSKITNLIIDIFEQGSSVHTTSNTLIYTGQSITIPANNLFAISASCVWSSGQPKQCRISTSSTDASNQNCVASNNEGATCSYVSRTGNSPLTLYIWGMWGNDTNNFSEVKGFRIPY